MGWSELEGRLGGWALQTPGRIRDLLLGRPVVHHGHPLDRQTHLLLAMNRLMLGRHDLGAEGDLGARRRRFRRSGNLFVERVRGVQVTEHHPTDAPALRSYRVDDAVGPGLIFFHGGGWTVGDLDSHDRVCRLLAARLEVCVLAVDYRLAPEHPFPAAFDDAVRAFTWVHTHADELRLDPTRLGVAGDSAGGNLAAALCVQQRDHGGPSPALQWLIYPACDLSQPYPSHEAFARGFYLTRAEIEAFKGYYTPDPANRLDPRCSPLRAASHAGLPPAVIQVAGYDPLRDEGEAYAAALRAAGVEVELLVAEGSIHGFLNMTGPIRAAAAALDVGLGAVRRALIQPSTSAVQP